MIAHLSMPMFIKEERCGDSRKWQQDKYDIKMEMKVLEVKGYKGSAGQDSRFKEEDQQNQCLEILW